MIEILIAVLLLLAIFMMIFAMLLISAYIVNSLIKELTVYDNIADMIKARKGVPCYIYHGLYGDWLCCGNCNGRIKSDYKVCPNCHYRIIFGIATPNLKPKNI
jgi:hypothetical protein